MNEVIKLIRAIIIDKLEDDLLYEAAEAILNACWDCKECRGSGRIKVPNVHVPKTPTYLPCPACDGTGEGGKILAVVDPNQRPPTVYEVHPEKSLQTDKDFIWGYNAALTQHKCWLGLVEDVDIAKFVDLLLTAYEMCCEFKCPYQSSCSQSDILNPSCKYFLEKFSGFIEEGK